MALKLDFPIFSGADSEGWLFQAEEYFAFRNIADDSRIQIAGFNMTKGALAWFRGLRRNNLLTSWECFKDDLRERFRDSVFDDKLEELSHLQQTSTVSHYLEQFEKSIERAQSPIRVIPH